MLSPCSKDWGEINYLKKDKLKYFWYIQNSALIVKRNLIEKISDFSNLNYIDFLFDGNNFRGFGLEIELSRWLCLRLAPTAWLKHPTSVVCWVLGRPDPWIESLEPPS